MDAQLISKLLDVDPEFGPFVERLYGVAKLHDPSEVHEAGTNPNRERKLARTALAAQGVAAVGGLHAIKTTIAEHRGIPKKPGKILPKIAPHLDSKKVALLGTAGWLGLHGVELAGDALGIRQSTRQLKKQPVSKVAGHFQPIGNIHANARFRQLGQRLPGATYRRPNAVVPPQGTQPVRKAMFRLVGQPEFVNGARARQAYKMPSAGHEGETPHGRHRAEVPRRELTRQGRFTIVGAAGAGVAGGGYGVFHHVQGAKRRRPAAIAPPPVKQQVQKGADCEWRAEISKLDEDKRQVFGWASLSKVDGQPVTDRQGDYIPIEESEEAAYRYMLNSRKGGDMHARITKADAGPRHTADVIESIVFTPEKIEALGLEPDAVPLGWWLGMQVHDEQQWDDIKTGKRTGFSVHGTGVRREMELV